MVKKNNNFFFELAKGSSFLFFGFIPISERFSSTMIVNINIMQAVTEAYFNDGKKKNGLEGLFLILFLISIKKISSDDNTKKILFKIWTLIYLHWNMVFCINQDYDYKSSLTHNLPPLITTLTKKFPTFDNYLFYWTSVRGCSLLMNAIYIIMDAFGNKGTEEFQIAFLLTIALKKLFKTS